MAANWGSVDRRPAGARILTSLFWPAFAAGIAALTSLWMFVWTGCVTQSDAVARGPAVERTSCESLFSSLTGVALPIWLNVVLLIILPPLLGVTAFLGIRRLQRPGETTW